MLCYDEEMALYHKRRFKDERFTDLLTQETQERNTLSRSNNYSMKNTYTLNNCISEHRFRCNYSATKYKLLR